jgi:hypothetical protein
MTDNKISSDPDNKGVEGLTEVLRLQAEALSRISERMAGMNQASSKFSPPPSVKAQHSDGLHLPVLAADPALNEDSLPVLNSFKQFLDQERRRGRKRFMWGLLGFTVAFSGVLAVIVWMNSERVHALKADIQQTSTRFDRSQQEAKAELKREAEKASQSVVKNTASIRSDITRNILWAHSTLASNMTTELTGRDDEIARLKEKVSTLEVDNTLLTRQVAELLQRVQIIETDYLDNLERPLFDGRSSEAVIAGRAASNVPPTDVRPAPLTINSARYGRSMQMQVPKE